MYLQRRASLAGGHNLFKTEGLPNHSGDTQPPHPRAGPPLPPRLPPRLGRNPANLRLPARLDRLRLSAGAEPSGNGGPKTQMVKADWPNSDCLEKEPQPRPQRDLPPQIGQLTLDTLDGLDQSPRLDHRDSCSVQLDQCRLNGGTILLHREHHCIPQDLGMLARVCMSDPTLRNSSALANR